VNTILQLSTPTASGGDPVGSCGPDPLTFWQWGSPDGHRLRLLVPCCYTWPLIHGISSADSGGLKGGERWPGPSRFTTIAAIAYTYSIPQTPHLLNLGRWCHLRNTLKYTICGTSESSKCFTSVTDIVIMSLLNNHAARLFQTTPYDRLILSNSWATCYVIKGKG